MFKLLIESGGSAELSFDLDADVVAIGAASTNDIVLTSPGVAPNHLVIRRTGSSYTFVGQHRQIVILNGKRRSRGVLAEGDRIRIGTATITVSGQSGSEFGETEAVTDEPETTAATEVVASREAESERQRAEVALLNEPDRLARARLRLLEVFQTGIQMDMVAALEGYFDSTFPGRSAMLAWLDQKGQLQPIVSNWSGSIPHLPSRTFAELAVGNRVAVLRGGDRELLIYPVPVGDDANVYLFAQSEGGDLEEDRTLLAELAGMLALQWDSVSSSSAFFGRWETDARQRLEQRLPGSSQTVGHLRDQLLAAARASSPVMLYGRQGSGRAYLASLIAALCPTGKPWIRVVQVREGDEAALRVELFGSDSTVGLRGLAERAGGGVVVVRDFHRMTSGLQRETASAIESDLGGGFGPKVRWVLTTDEDCMGLVAEGRIDSLLANLVQEHLIRVPPLDERREDLPLVIVRMLEAVGAEQGKKIPGIALETIDSLLCHPFDGQMTELLHELRRLVSATPDGEIVRGSVSRSTVQVGGASGEDDELIDTALVLGHDDLKVVIPAVEKLLIDRVLRRALGNQSKAARELNLSRGALIAKIKEYSIPDYRSLRRSK
jgi:DNA-binding NtrC family response regulator